MLRRSFITLLGGAAAVWPLAARAQQPAMPVVGYLNPASPESAPQFAAGFRKGLSETGYVDGRNVAIEYRWAYNDVTRLPDLAADLVRRRVDVIAATTNNATLAAKAATTTIPIAFAVGGDPVSMGLVASLNRPGGNMTGVTFLSTTTVAIRLQMLREASSANVIAALMNPANPQTELQIREAQEASRILGFQLQVLDASSERDIEAAFELLLERRAGALFIEGDPYLTSRLKQLAALSLRHAIPAIFPVRDFPDTGGLMSYGASVADAYRIAGVYVGRILKGDKPADLPVQQAVKVELILNLTTAKAMGLTFPLTLLGRADEVIE